MSITSNEKLLELMNKGAFIEVVEALKNNILEEDLPKSGIKELSFIKRYMKTIERPDFKGIIYGEDDRKYICNSYSLVEVSQCYNFEDAKTEMKPDDLFPDKRDYVPYEFVYKKLINKLKVGKVEYKKDKKNVFMLTDDIAVNPNYLYEILTAMGKDTRIGLGDGTNPVYLENEEGRRSILLPVRIRA